MRNSQESISADQQEAQADLNQALMIAGNVLQRYIQTIVRISPILKEIWIQSFRARWTMPFQLKLKHALFWANIKLTEMKFVSPIRLHGLYKCWPCGNSWTELWTRIYQALQDMILKYFCPAPFNFFKSFPWSSRMLQAVNLQSMQTCWQPWQIMKQSQMWQYTSRSGMSLIWPLTSTILLEEPHSSMEQQAIITQCIKLVQLQWLWAFSNNRQSLVYSSHNSDSVTCQMHDMHFQRFKSHNAQAQ